jgi:hypothetical protein
VKPILPRVNLASGKHMSPNEGACIMEVLALATSAQWVDYTATGTYFNPNEYVHAGRWVMRDGWDFTDLPECTDDQIAVVAQKAWDAIAVPAGPRVEEWQAEQTERLRMLARFLPRLLRAKRTQNKRVRVRLALAACRQVQRYAWQAEAALDVVERWLVDGEEIALDRAALILKNLMMMRNGGSDDLVLTASTPVAAVLASDVSSYDHRRNCAVVAAYLTCCEAMGQETGTREGVLAYASACFDTSDERCRDLQAMLDALLDALEKARAEEGEMFSEPEPWEADAIAFVDQLMAEVAATLAA